MSKRQTLRAQDEQRGRGNNLLAALPAAEYRRLLASLETVALKFDDVLNEPGVPIQHVYFPIDCAISLLTVVKHRPALEVALVGHEGMVGSPLALGILVSSRRAQVQAAGTAMRMGSAAFRKELLHGKALQQTLFRYKHALIEHIVQSAVCNKFHSVQERLARYLLTIDGRTGAPEISLTQQLLANALGAQRPAVSNAVHFLEVRDLIRGDRGKVTILDRKRLGAASCECYQIIGRNYARV